MPDTVRTLHRAVDNWKKKVDLTYEKDARLTTMQFLRLFWSLYNPCVLLGCCSNSDEASNNEGGSLELKSDA